MKEPWRTIFLVLVILLSFGMTKACDADAAEKSLTFGLWTQHYAGDHTEGLDNHLVALEYDGWTGAFFRNSYGNETAFLAHTWHTDKLKFYEDWYIQGNLSAGVLIGYGDKHPIHLGVFSPGVYPTLSVGKGNHSVGLGVMPTFWWLQYRVEF